jgi:hypothetical protein
MEQFGHYQLETLIGHDGTAEIYRALDTRRGRAVTLERLPPRATSDPGHPQRFHRVSEIAARLSCPHVLPIHDYGEIEGTPYIDMRLPEGIDLGTLIATSGPLPPTRAVEIIAQVAEALDATHRQGLVHGALTPATVLITDDNGRDFAYLLLSFGTTPPTSGTADLPPGPMAPAATSTGHAPVDPRADIHALGCLLFVTVTGCRPFADHPQQSPLRLSTIRPDLPPGLDQVISQAMAHKPAGTYGSAGAVANAARHALTGAPPRSATPQHPSPPPSIPHWSPPAPGVSDAERRRGLAVLGVVGGAAALVTLAVVLALAVARGHATPVPAAVSATAPTSTATPAPLVPDTLTGAFPDIAALGRCESYQPQNGYYVVNDGTAAAAVLRCPVPGPAGNVYFAQWPTAIQAQQYYDEMRGGQTSVDGKDTWSIGFATQGSMYTGTDSDGSYSLFTYNGSRYTFEVDAHDVASDNSIFRQLNLRAVGDMPS